MNSDLRKRTSSKVIFTSALIGLLVAACLGGLILLAYQLLSATFGPLILLPPDFGERVLHHWNLETVLPLPTNFIELALLVLIGSTALGAVIGALIVSLRLDPHQSVAVSLRWAARALLAHPMATIAALLPCVLIGLSPLSARWLWLSILALPAGLLLFGIFQSRIADSSDGKGWWRPTWPGRACVASVMLLFSLVVIVSIGSGMVEEGLTTPWYRISQLVAWLIEMLLFLSLYASILFRIEVAVLHSAVSTLLRREVLGPWLIQELLTAIAFAPVLLLVIGESAFNVYIEPQLASIALQGALPTSATLWTGAIHALGGPIAGLWAGIVLLVSLLLRSRLLMLTAGPRMPLVEYQKLSIAASTTG